MMSKPRIFISHSESNFAPTGYAIRIIDLLGCVPVIAETQPKMSRPVHSLVKDSLDSCDAAIIILTPDKNVDGKYEPSPGVLVEIGKLQEHEKLKDRYMVIKEKSVSVTSPMIPETRYSFEKGDFGPIAEAILTELSAMGLYSNYHSLNGSEFELHKLMDVLSKFRDLHKAEAMPIEDIKKYISESLEKFIDKVVGGDENE